jgi:hydrogenase large subunit
MSFEKPPEKQGGAHRYSFRGESPSPSPPAPPPPAPAPAAVEPTGEPVRHVDFDPVSRVAGPLGFHTVVDLDRGEVLEAAASASLFRGYEVILQGRDPRDAIFVSSRACGVCGGAHATTSALALEMALGVQPPPLAIAARNMLSAIEYLYDHPTHLFLRAGPDFSAPVVQATNPELWTRAQQTLAARADTHGFARLSDIMEALTRETGELYLEALEMARVARQAYVLLGGKYPHPQTIVPGGISATVDVTDLNVTMLRMVRFFDYGRKVVAVWDDLVDFFYEADPRFREVGEGPMNFIDLGQWDDPDAYDGTFENAPEWGERRWATPGAIVEGRLRTTDLHRINSGVEEFVDHSFYEDWTRNGDHPLGDDPAGNRLSSNHPWNKETIPRPGRPDWKGKYSWSTAPRWDRQPMETGAYARLWVTAMANKMPHRRFLEPTGHSLKMSVPQSEMPRSEVEWHVPERWNAFERNRARAYALVYSALVAYESLLICYDLLREGGADAKASTPYKIPKDYRVGVGFGGGARGYVSHHLALDNRVIENYQIIGSSTFTASPADHFGNPGPCEEAVLATPLLSTQQRERCTDVLRAIRSFDPCMACTTH